MHFTINKHLKHLHPKHPNITPNQTKEASFQTYGISISNGISQHSANPSISPQCHSITPSNYIVSVWLKWMLLCVIMTCAIITICKGLIDLVSFHPFNWIKVTEKMIVWGVLSVVFMLSNLFMSHPLYYRHQPRNI